MHGDRAVMGGDASQAIGNEALKVAPAVAVAGTSMIGLDWQTVVYIVTAGYVLLQSAYLLWKWHRDWRDKPRAAPTVPPPAE